METVVMEDKSAALMVVKRTVLGQDHCKSQEKLETMLMQNLGAQTKSIMVFSGAASSNGSWLPETTNVDLGNQDNN